ncbi:MAG: redoxin domain-containing protein [Bacteroidetes bacterium]|nr:redoxin domain-containing protein [Bacteroidota bacterium]
MKNKFNLILAFLAFLSSFGFATTVKINGTAETYRGAEAELVVYEDFFSLKERVLTSAPIDANGKFALQADIASIAKAFIRIDNVASSIYLEPGNVYTLIIPAITPGKEVQGALNFINHQMISSKPGTLNNSIQLFNRKYDQFLEDHYSLIITKAAKPKIEEFKSKMGKEYDSQPDQFLKQYVTYSIASLSQLAFSSKKALFRNYINEKPVLYNNPEYISFIKEFYANHLLLLSQSSKGAYLMDMINNKDYTAIITLYKFDTTLANPQLRELILIKGLQEAYNMKSVKKPSVAYLLKQVAEKTTYPKHKVIAENLLWSLSRFEQGQKAPEFELTDVNGQTITLDKLKGKYVYLNFWATWCTSCVNDLKIMKALQEKYKQNIVFVSVSLDKNMVDYQNFLKKNPMNNWQFAHYSSDKKIINDYAARGLPIYYLISPDGRFIEAPASPPSENVEVKFQALTKSQEKRVRVGEN